MKNVKRYAQKQLKRSFEDWTEDGVKGYRTAMLEIIDFIVNSTISETENQKTQRIWDAYFEFDKKIHFSDKHEGLNYFKAGIEYEKSLTQ